METGIRVSECIVEMLLKQQEDLIPQVIPQVFNELSWKNYMSVHDDLVNENSLIKQSVRISTSIS